LAFFTQIASTQQPTSRASWLCTQARS
jgi:hypothetical protein